MGLQRTKRGRASARSRLASKANPSFVNLDQRLSEVLTSIAHLLLRNGYGFSRLSKLTKVAFVNAAKSLDTESSSRVSVARIAAITGLTRLEVSQILRSSAYQLALNGEPLNRAERVAVGWLSDEEFCDSRGQPRSLPFIATRRSFSRLVKKYSGDIPARAMLNEMKRLKMVSHDSNDTVRFERGRRTDSRMTLSAIRAITPWVSFLADISSPGRKGALTSTAQTLRLTFDSRPQSLAASREIEARRGAFVEGLRQLGRRDSTSSRFQLDLSIGVAVAAAKPVASTKHRVSKK